MDDGPVTIPGGFFKNPAGIRVALKVKSQNVQGRYSLAPFKLAIWFTLITWGGFLMIALARNRCRFLTDHVQNVETVCENVQF